MDEAGASRIPQLPGAPFDEELPASLQAIVQAVVEHLSHGGGLQGLAARCEALEIHPEVRVALEQAVGLGLTIGEAWLLLALWANGHGADAADAAVTAALLPHLDTIDAAILTECLQLFDRVLGVDAREGWGVWRSRRLRQAMGRTAPT
jgi:hypothetical protein